MTAKLLRVGLIIGVLLALVVAVAYWQRANIARAYLDLPPFTSGAQPVIEQRVKMRDGIELATRVFLPDGKGPWPTLLVRDPYAFYEVLCGLFAHYDYACVHQDVRGRFESGGEWYPVIHERDDGVDTLNWLLGQSWQNGNIATFGSSYVGIVQWAMVDLMPQEVKTLVADVSHGDMYDIVYHNGHFIHGIMTHWMLGLVGGDTSVIEMAAFHPNSESSKALLDTPQRWYNDYLANDDKSGEYWSGTPYSEMRSAHQSAHMPILMTGAWHDFFLDGQFEVFEALPRREESLFSIRTGSHAASPDASPAQLIGDWLRLTLGWLQRHLRHDPSVSFPAPGYLLQNNADGSKRHYKQWPAAARELVLHLDKLGDAGHCDGGALASETPANKGGGVSFNYDPTNPAPSRAGSFQFETGVVDQGTDYCSRADVLSFASDVFETPTTISGSVRVALSFETSAPASAVVVKLMEHVVDGRVLNIREDIIAIDGSAGSAADLTLNLTPIQWTLRPGSYLRLDISSSSYPIFNAHPNARGLWSRIVPSESATQTLHSGRLEIPLE